jgi:hypothetical protein
MLLPSDLNRSPEKEEKENPSMIRESMSASLNDTNMNMNMNMNDSVVSNDNSKYPSKRSVFFF